MYYNPGLWPTRDGVVPYRLFFQVVGDLNHLKARERFELVMGTAHAIALSIAGKKEVQRIKAMTRKLSKEAFPEVS